MGQLFSKDSGEPPLEEDSRLEDLLSRIDKLEQSAPTDIEDRLHRLESQADLDHDGIVTREEMETFMATKLQLRETELLELRDALRREQEDHEKLKEKYEELLELYNAEHPSGREVSRISGKVIKKFISEQLEDPEHNWKLIPDILEKPAKLAKYQGALELLEHLFSMGSFDIAGHRIQGSIRPIEK